MDPKEEIFKLRSRIAELKGLAVEYQGKINGAQEEIRVLQRIPCPNPECEVGYIKIPPSAGMMQDSSAVTIAFGSKCQLCNGTGKASGESGQ